MISFKKISLEDMDVISPYLKKENAQQVDYHFPVMYLWQHMYEYDFCIEAGWLFISLTYQGEIRFLMPMGDGDIRQAITMLEEYCRAGGISLKLSFLDERHKKKLEEALPGRFTFTTNPENFDYICLAQKLSTYSGRALRGKKRPCNHFEKNYESWSFKEITEENAGICRELISLWNNENEEKMTEGIIEEEAAIEKALKNFKKLGLDGGILYAEKTPVAFTIGNMIREDTCDTFFEKADTAVDGAYAMVCREFTRYLMNKYPKLVYINREEDMGLEYMRKAKEMSDPEYRIVKYSAVPVKN